MLIYARSELVKNTVFSIASLGFIRHTKIYLCVNLTFLD